MPTNIAAGAAAAVAGVSVSAVSQIALMVYEKVMGNAYSKANRSRLAELKKIYQQLFQVSPPLHWELDEKNKPTYCLKNQQWTLYLRQLRQVKESMGYYHYQSHLIAEHAATYLSSRRRRWFGGRKPGDLLEQFFGEWIHFALSDLPTFRVDELAINRIKDRIAYIEQVQKHENIFKYGRLKRDKNKADAMEGIKQQLQNCLIVAAKEASRQCAREQLNCCRLELSALLLASAQTLYYARQHAVDHEPLNLQHYVDLENAGLSLSSRKIYPIVRQTHTGEMLNEILLLAGLEAFGSVECSNSQAQHTTYFSKQGKKQAFVYEKDKSDLPKWVSDSEKEGCLKAFHGLGEAILRVAHLKKCVEMAYDLTGKIGDFWAYGDHTGKLSLQALIALLEKEVSLLKKSYDGIYHYHNQKRQRYNLQHRVNPGNGANPNFNKVDEQQAEFHHATLTIYHALAAMRHQMDAFPKDEKHRIDQQKTGFYQSLYCYLQQFCPDWCYDYQLLNAVLEKKGTEEPKATPAPAVQRLNVLLTWPLKFHERDAAYLYLGKPAFHDFYKKFFNAKHVAQPLKNWQVGQSYKHWTTHFFVFNQEQFTVFQKFALTLQEMLQQSASSENIAMLSMIFNQYIQYLKQKINDEKPAWRFKWAFWPIKTAGWPFNWSARQFSKLLLHELQVTQAKVGVIREALKDSVTMVSTKTLSLSSTALTVQALARTEAPSAMNATLVPEPAPQQTSTYHAHEWFKKVNKAFQKWQAQKERFVLFKNIAHYQAFIDDILRDYESIPLDIMPSIMQSRLAVVDLLQLEIDYSDHLDYESAQQMKLITLCKTLLKSQSHRSERQQVAVDVLKKAEQIFLASHILPKEITADNFSVIKGEQHESSFNF